MTIDELRALVERITYKPGWRFEVVEKGAAGDVMCLRVAVAGTCNATGSPLAWSGRPWFISAHATPSEVLQTALKAVLTAEEHEAREHFRVDGVEVFCPHLNLFALARVIRHGIVEEDVRPTLIDAGGPHPVSESGDDERDEH